MTSTGRDHDWPRLHWRPGQGVLGFKELVSEEGIMHQSPSGAESWEPDFRICRYSTFVRMKMRSSRQWMVFDTLQDAKDYAESI